RLRPLRDGTYVHLREDLPGQLVGVRAVAGVELEPREPERRRRPGGALAVEVADQLRDRRPRRRGKRLLVVRQTRGSLLGRLPPEEARLVGGRALAESIDHVGEDPHRLVGTARRQRALAAAQHVARRIFVGHLAAIHHHGAGGPAAGGQQGREEEDALHCSTCTWASLGGTKRNSESGSPTFTFTSWKISWFTSPCPLVSTVARTCPC